jgi:hypothetical protein
MKKTLTLPSKANPLFVFLIEIFRPLSTISVLIFFHFLEYPYKEDLFIELLADSIVGMLYLILSYLPHCFVAIFMSSHTSKSIMGIAAEGVKAIAIYIVAILIMIPVLLYILSLYENSVLSSYMKLVF